MGLSLTMSGIRNLFFLNQLMRKTVIWRQIDFKSIRIDSFGIVIVTFFANLKVTLIGLFLFFRFSKLFCHPVYRKNVPKYSKYRVFQEFGLNLGKKIMKWLFLIYFRPLFKHSVFFETSGAVWRLCLSLSNYQMKSLIHTDQEGVYNRPGMVLTPFPSSPPVKLQNFQLRPKTTIRLQI